MLHLWSRIKRKTGRSWTYIRRSGPDRDIRSAITSYQITTKRGGNAEIALLVELDLLLA